jgi:pimeloyl-ACP methyl ester carboxylesterase
MIDFNPKRAIAPHPLLLNLAMGGLLVIVILLISPVQARAATSPAVRVPALSWSDCGGGFQCATAAVPLDYDRPQDGTISLALIRMPATDQAHRIGSLFTNPGGPGGSGVGFIRLVGKMFPAAIRARFDIIGFDPRGVVESTPVRCFGSVAAQQAFLEKIPPFPVGAQEQRAYRQAYRQFDQQCAQLSARILPHVSTANVARDMDLLRQAVGDAKLSYWGQSYGTYLGETYANLFPTRFRALYLDAVLDPIAYATGRDDQANHLPAFLRLGGNVGASQTLQAFLELCAAAGTSQCTFAADSAQTTADKFDALLQRLRKQPIVLQTSQGPITYTYASTVHFVWASLFNSHGWPQLAATLQALFQHTGLQASRAALALGQPYQQSQLEGAVANFCVDTANPANPLAYPAIARQSDPAGRHHRRPIHPVPRRGVSLPRAGQRAAADLRWMGPHDLPARQRLHRPLRNRLPDRRHAASSRHHLSPGLAPVRLGQAGGAPVVKRAAVPARTQKSASPRRWLAMTRSPNR